MPLITTRSYTDADRDAALAIFDSNLPEYFGPGERAWFEESLDDPDGPALVLAIDGQPVAFGGWEVWDHYNKALLCWGMVHRSSHALALGRLLLLERVLGIARSAPATRWVTVDTSPLVAPFFVHCGFEQTSVWPGGYRSGMTMHELRLDLAGADVAALEGRRDAARERAQARIVNDR
ncbi:GNAT family N-acetyltransferase [Sphingomonas bacterium]|uniref:GNAT family N-acetyltransferase n=1 Tax=Sphingomonas bacterium TaxID=1895847 RepID=UPI0015775619|nr:GNAT family N-acetyltransferase [Sphingomonas bacterium]